MTNESMVWDMVWDIYNYEMNSCFNQFAHMFSWFDSHGQFDIRYKIWYWLISSICSNFGFLIILYRYNNSYTASFLNLLKG